MDESPDFVFPLDSCDADLASMLRRVARAVPVVATTDYVKAEVADPNSFWRAFVQGTAGRAADPDAISRSLALCRLDASPGLLTARSLGEFAATQEMAAVCEAFCSYKATLDPGKYLSDRALFDYCVASTDGALAARVLIELSGLTSARFRERVASVSLLSDDSTR